MKAVMLAANKEPNWDNVSFPVIASGKLDGVRGCVQEGQLVSRSLKDSLNRSVVAKLSNHMFDGLDGELCLEGEDWQNFNCNQSAFMTQNSIPDFVWHVFEDMSSSAKTVDRKAMLRRRVATLKSRGYPVEYCEQHTVSSKEELFALYEHYRDRGYEGLIVMSPDGLYKHGRSTLKQEIMIKMKPHEDDEAIVTGFDVVMHNDDAGNSKRAENLYEGDRAGKIVAKWRGKEIRIGTGFSHSEAKSWWDNTDKFIGKAFKFKYMELTPYGEPRCAVFVGFRQAGDML